jgi:hypothetical protein
MTDQNVGFGFDEIQKNQVATVRETYSDDGAKRKDKREQEGEKIN